MNQPMTWNTDYILFNQTVYVQLHAIVVCREMLNYVYKKYVGNMT